MSSREMQCNSGISNTGKSPVGTIYYGLHTRIFMKSHDDYEILPLLGFNGFVVYRSSVT